MSAALKTVATIEPPSNRIGWLADTIRRNRFMPIPPEDRMFVGDGDYRAIGAEFLRHAVELGDLRPDARVLDIGCGIGRLAVPLTQYLDPERGSYDGVDPVRSGIEWCTTFVTPAYPNFRFQHLDIRHAIYNPTGAIDGTETTLPFGDAAFDFMVLVSVATHLPAAELARYFDEVARVLAPGGRLMLTAFVMTRNSDPPPKTRDPRLNFTRSGATGEWHADAANPLGAVAVDDGVIEEAADAADLEVRRKTLGHWRGRPAAHYQDIFIIGEKRGRR
jgi:SAM-dependent methyltransferase